MIYLQLFWVYVKIGLLGFGGGYTMFIFIQDEIVQKYGWISMEQFTDIVAVSQMTPGPIGVNMATYIGHLTTGNIWGSIVACTALCAPSSIITIIIAYYFNKFRNNKFVESLVRVLLPISVGLIASAILLLVNNSNFIDYFSCIIFAISFVLAKWLKLNPILVVLIAGLLGFFIYYIL